MPERVRVVWNRFLEFWNRYNRRQKTIVISSLATTIIALIILAVILSRPQYSVLKTCANYNEMSQVTTLLADNGYPYTTNDTSLTVSVRQQDITAAKMLLASSEITVDGYSFEDAMNSSFSTTESDRQKMYQNYLKYQLEDDLENLDKVESAQVTLNLQQSTNSLFASTSGSSVGVILRTSGEMDEAEAENIAYLLKDAVPNLALKDITIMSTTGESLYTGSTSSVSGSVSSLNKQLKYAETMQNTTANAIRNTVLSTGLYNDVKVIVHYDINWSEMQKVAHEYTLPDGAEENGFLTESYEEKSSGGTVVGGTPGTESNNQDTDYEIQDSSSNTSSYNLNHYWYVSNELVTTETTSPGAIIQDSSTLSAVFTKVVIYNEDDAKALGYLDDLTWEEFKAQNADPVQIPFDQEWLNNISNGTGIPLNNISIVAYEQHMFYDHESSARSITWYLQIILAIAILGLLAYVILRSAKPIAVEETEPELSVEQMLATTKETQSVEDIDLQEKSEVRKAIEKFVDENPEAVALLLRNWLDDGWD